MSDWIRTGNFCNFKRKENFANQDKHSQTLVTTLVLDGNLFRTLETGCIHNIKVNICPPNLLIRIIIINILLSKAIFLNLYYHHRQDRAQHLDWFSIHGTTGSILLDRQLIYRTATSRHSGQLPLSLSYIYTFSLIFQYFGINQSNMSFSWSRFPLSAASSRQEIADHHFWSDEMIHQVKFLSISHCAHLERLDQSSIALLPLVETITLRWSRWSSWWWMSVVNGHSALYFKLRKSVHVMSWQQWWFSSQQRYHRWW